MVGRKNDEILTKALNSGKEKTLRNYFLRIFTDA